MGKFVKIVVFAPVSCAEKIRQAMASVGCGHIGKYDFCSFSVKGVGRFRALKGANPFIGKVGKIEKVAEERIETICPKAKLKKALAAIKTAHPYEEPAVDVYPLINPKSLPRRPRLQAGRQVKKARNPKYKIQKIIRN